LVMGKDAKKPRQRNKSFDRIEDYVLTHLGIVGSDLADIMDEITELLAHEDRHQYQKDIPGRLKFLRHLARQKMDYMQKVLSDITMFNLLLNEFYST